MIVRPVIDVRGGLVVRAVAGRRTAYAPRRPAWCRTADPLDFARRQRDRLGTRRLYLADLDAIEHGPRSGRANRRLWDALTADGFDLLLDPGVRTAADVADLSPAVSRVVASSESAESQRELRAAAGAGCVLGLDLGGDRFVGPAGGEGVITRAANPVLVLDVAAVGVGGGVPTLPRCRELVAANPDRAVLTGGGVRGIGDVRGAAAAGVAELLVASALDDGRLGAEALRPYLVE